MPVNTDARLHTYLSGSGWVILDDNDQPILHTFDDHNDSEVAALVRQYNDLADEVERLRAALAARPQPLFEGTIHAFTGDNRSIMVAADEAFRTSTYHERFDRQRVAVYPAVAGSATPTDKPQMMQSKWPASAGDRTMAMEDVAGPATATPPKWEYKVPDFGSGQVDVAGSATPTGDDDE